MLLADIRLQIIKIRFADTGRVKTEATPMSTLATLTILFTSKFAQGYRKPTLNDISICA